MRSIAASSLALLAACASAPPAQKTEAAIPPPSMADEASQDAMKSPLDRAYPPALAPCVRWLRTGSWATSVEATEMREYQRALALERAGSMDDARKLFFEISDNTRDPVLKALTHLHFGLLFDLESREDPTKYAFAEGAYGTAVGERTLAPLALYLMAGLQERIGNHAYAIDCLTKTVKYSEAEETICSRPLIEAARRDIVPYYAVWGHARRAWQFFWNIFGDHAPEPTIRLIEQYERDGKAADARAALLGALKVTTPAPRICAFADRVRKEEEARFLRYPDPNTDWQELARAMEACRR